MNEIISNIFSNIYNIITIISLVSISVTFLINMIKAIKAKKVLVKENIITTLIKEYMNEAESILSRGVEKKCYVLHKLSEYILHNNITYDIDKVSNRIDEYITFSKSVQKKWEENKNGKTF